MNSAALDIFLPVLAVAAWAWWKDRLPSVS